MHRETQAVGRKGRAVRSQALRQVAAKHEAHPN